jgi:GTPase SAR1 family protein
MRDHPVFAVVGHPNKGKSSVVAALTQNDQVRISPVSGTTRVSQHFALKLDNKVVFELVDTPGFQRANKCLAWLNQEVVTADQRPHRVDAFVAHFTGRKEFIDEVELLTPIMQGAGIIYVIDGSLPYSPEYETEMEILRWTGSARLALINPIGGDTYVEQWRQALNQYFSLVRVFDPLHASFDQHLQLLRTFGQLDAQKTADLDFAIEELERYRKLKLQQAARIIVENLYRLITFHQSSSRLEKMAKVRLAAVMPDEIIQFNEKLNSMEREGQQQLEALFLYHQLEADMSRLQVHKSELMDVTHWSLWGLEKGQLILVSAGAGAAIGLLADVGLGGTSLMTGAVSGSVVGGLSGWLGLDWLKDKLPSWLSYNSEKHLLGPVKDPNFSFVILGRALSHAGAMLIRSHADQNKLVIDQGKLNAMQSLALKTQVRLLKQFRQLSDAGLQSKAADKLRTWVFQQLTNDA